MRLPCLSIGPRTGGRDYGLLPRFRTDALTGEAAATIGDFALSLLDWGFHERDDFACCLPLDRARSAFLVARVAFLRREALGPVVLANGLLLDRDALAAAEGRPHRYLPLVLPPRRGEWSQVSIEGRPERPALPPASPIEDLARALQIFPGRIYVEAAGGVDPEALAAMLAESAPARTRGELGWATTVELAARERFDPAALDFVVSRAPADVSRDYRWDGAKLDGPPLPNSPAWRVWSALFATSANGALGDILAGVQWDRANAAAEPGKVAAAAILECLSHGKLDQKQFWALMAHWARRAAELDAGDREAAAAAVSRTLSKMVDRQEDRRVKVGLLGDYLKFVDPIQAGVATELQKPAAIAAHAQVIDLLAADDLALLMDRGLGTRFAAGTRDAVRSGMNTAQLDAIAAPLQADIAREPVAETVSLASAVLEARVEAQEPPGDDMLLFAARLLSIVPRAEVERHGTLLARAWRRAPPSPSRQQLIDEVRAWPRAFWADQGDPGKRRNMAAALAFARRETAR